MTPLLVVGGVVLLFVLLFTLPFHIEIRQEDYLFITVRLLGIRLYRFDPSAPKKEKEPKEKKKGKKKKPPKEKELSEEKSGKSKTKETLSLVFDLLGDAVTALGRFVRRLKIIKLKIRLIVAEEDAAQTAVAYGKMCAYVYGGFAALNNLIKIKKPDIQIGADFTKEDYDFSLLCVVSVALWMPLAAVLRVMWALVKRTIAKAKEDGAEAPENSHKNKDREKKPGQSQNQKEKAGSV